MERGEGLGSFGTVLSVGEEEWPNSGTSLNCLPGILWIRKTGTEAKREEE